MDRAVFSGSQNVNVMKLGNLEIRFVPSRARARIVYNGAKDLTGVFAVPDTDPIWLGVHQVVDEIEREATEAARNRVGNTNQCLSAIGASEGAAMVRLRLIEKRENALRERKATNQL